MEVNFMNGEIAQICNIVLATKSALKKRSRIRYKPIYYEKKLHSYFLITKNIRLKVLRNGLIIVLIEDYKILSS